MAKDCLVPCLVPCLLLCLSLFNSVAYSDVSTDSETFEIGGYLMIDHDYFGAFYNKDESQYQHKTEIRRSKLSLTSQPNQHIKVKLQLKYARVFQDKDKLFLGDAYIRLKSDNNISLQLGRMKEPFGLEQQTSSSELIAIERSLATNTFSPGRSFGAQLDYKTKKNYFAIGYYIDRDNRFDFSLANFDLSQQGEKDIKALTMRLTIAPIQKKHSTIHLGSSFSKRWLNNKAQYKIKGEVHTADSIIRSARFYADDSLIYQVDWALHKNQFLMQGELFANEVLQSDGKSWFYTGGYIQASYRFLGGYKYKKGVFKSAKLKRALAFECVIRHSYVDLNDHDVGSKASSSVIGANIYITSLFKLMANMTIPTITGDTVNNNQTGYAYSFRAQLSF
jgi:phosphate-selective porin OprO/OprP